MAALVGLAGTGATFAALSDRIASLKANEERVAAAVAEAPDERVRLTVAGTGIGIAPKAMEQIFEPFMQANTEIRRRHGGTGLGLPIVKRLVTLLGGDIGVTAAPGGGACFTVDLPRAPNERPVPLNKGDAGEPPGGG